MRVLILTILTITLLDLTLGHRPWRVYSNRKQKHVYTNPFGSVLCRLRHYKNILDENDKIVSCQKSCPTDFVERYSVLFGHHCMKINYPTGCADRFCLRCTPGYKYLYAASYRDRCVKKCPKGYVEMGDQCMKCTHDCDECTSMWTCKKCVRRFSLYETFTGSIICVRHCPFEHQRTVIDGITKCVKNVITDTPDGLSTPTSSTTKKQPVVTTKKEEIRTTQPVLPEGCKDVNCVNCQPGFFKYYPPSKGSHCVRKCPIGHTELDFLCVACSDRRCASCKASLAECDRCYPGYSMLLNSANITMECVRTCPSGYKQRSSGDIQLCIPVPEPECPIVNCARCVGSDLHSFHRGCEKCATGYTLFRGAFNDHCYENCPPGFYKAVKPGTDVTVCAQCAVAFCNNCSDANTCSECIAPMVLDESTGRCTTCPALRQYSFTSKRCVDADLNRPESNDLIDLY